jgi:ribonucleotide reductase beta subunit family protein with ferritin-like domain
MLNANSASGEETARIPHVLEPTESLVVRYQPAVTFTEEQLKIFWLPDEIKVEKDVQDVLTNFTPSEKHGVMTTLKLFSLYELKAGAEYWGNRFMRTFPRPEFQRMGSTFATFELAIHKPFYNKINELLHVATDEFYTGYVKDPVLKDRIDFIDSIVDAPMTPLGNLYSLGAFSMVEGAILYSSFAFLKHFQSKGKNKLLNIVRGINFSVRDENLHSIAGAWAFKELKEQLALDAAEQAALQESLTTAARKVYEHEARIVEMIFEKGPMDGITEAQMKNFVQSRIDFCMQQLGYPKVFDVKYNPIADWFYDGINGFMYNDFFSGVGNQYNRDWDSSAFVWNSKNVKKEQ